MVTKEQVRPVWKCSVEGCDYTAAPTVEGYKKISGHQLAHTGLPKTKRGFRLVDESTGKILAQKLEEATTKGFIATKPAAPLAPETKHAPPEEPLSEAEPPEPQAPTSPPVPETKHAPEPTPPAAKSTPSPTSPPTATEPELTAVRTAGIFTYEITLPSDAFTLYNLAKALELETDGDKSFDEWVWDCITARFAKDYKKQLILAPVE